MEDKIISAGNNHAEILIVEDSPTQLEELKYILEKKRFRVIPASNGKEALEVLNSRCPDIVISDILMPEMDGYELCKRLRADERFRHIPVILVTTLSDPKDVIKGLECGANNFIVKPYDEKYLVSRIQYLIANFELRKDAKAEMGINVFFLGDNYFITAERLQILDLLLSTYENAYHQNRELLRAQKDQKDLNEQLQVALRSLEDLNRELDLQNRELLQRRHESEQARQQADEASKAKSDFLANMSHELRTPLNSVIGFSEILEDRMFGELNEKQLEYVQDISSSGKHLLSLINDILDLSKVESGKMELDPSRFPLKKAVGAAMTMLKEKAMRHGIKLDMEIGPDADIEIEADERKLKQIMFNLLSNAVKFTPDGGSVRVSAQRVDGVGAGLVPALSHTGQPQGLPLQAFIEISVSDTGIGIKPEDMDKLFKEFSQVESAYTKKHEGTGLGLALTKRLVELHGGKVWGESEYGRGSRFTFVIPLRQ